MESDTKPWYSCYNEIQMSRSTVQDANNFIEPIYAHLMVIGVNFFDQKSNSGLLIIPLKPDFAPVRPDKSIILSLRWWSGVPQDLLKTFSYISGALSPRSTVYHGGGGETLWLKICVSGVQFRHYIYQALCLGSMINHFSCMRFGRISREQIFLLLSFLFWGGHFGSWCQWF